MFFTISVSHTSSPCLGTFPLFLNGLLLTTLIVPMVFDSLTGYHYLLLIEWPEKGMHEGLS